MGKIKAVADADFFENGNREAIRKAWRAGKRVIRINGRLFNLEQAAGKAGKPFILVLPLDGHTPMAQIEKVKFGSSKVTGKDGKKFVKPQKS